MEPAHSVLEPSNVRLHMPHTGSNRARESRLRTEATARMSVRDLYPLMNEYVFQAICGYAGAAIAATCLLIAFLRRHS